MKSSKPVVTFRIVNCIILALLAFITLYPFWHAIMYSLSNSKAAMRGTIFLYPHSFSLDAYMLLGKTKQIFVTYWNSIFRTLAGTAINLVLTASIAYPLSLKRFVGRNFLSMAIFLTMLFSGGMIPHFLLVRDLGLLDSIWSLILPIAISPFNMFIMRNYFQSLPASLEESANLDGATPMRTLVSIIIPVSSPVFAALAMFYGIAHWNAFFDSILYINDPNKQVLQAYLRSMINITAFGQTTSAQDRALTAGMSEETMRMAAISASVVPVLLVYPWLQKYYVKGVLLGSIKG